ncbi:MAG: tRNA (guanosine(37)-N1)-methyltransferase TrmD [Alphaproteobacteria bacterium]|jgi:tRNA (guanine37-N1)-methyltransferase
MHFSILTLFPSVFPPYLHESILGQALEKKLWSYDLINIRDFSDNKHNKVDDTPFGGGAGMVLKPEVVAKAVESINLKQKIIYLSPKGKVFNQKMAVELAKEPNLTLLSGRYEGVDERVIDYFQMEEVSVGDYILTGGELPALILIDAIVRNIKGVLGNDESLKEESFSINNSCKLLEYPIYTKPQIWRGVKVPDELLTGNHQLIKEWRLKQSLQETLKKRPDLKTK